MRVCPRCFGGHGAGCELHVFRPLARFGAASSCERCFVVAYSAWAGESLAQHSFDFGRPHLQCHAALPSDQHRVCSVLCRRFNTPAISFQNIRLPEIHKAFKNSILESNSSGRDGCRCLPNSASSSRSDALMRTHLDITREIYHVFSNANNTQHRRRRRPGRQDNRQIKIHLARPGRL